MEDNRSAWGRGCAKGIWTTSFQKKKAKSNEVNTFSFIGCLLPIRVVITLLGFCALVCSYTNRVSISHVITMLVVPINRTETQTNEEVCPKEDTPEAPSKNTVSQIHIYVYSIPMVPCWLVTYPLFHFHSHYFFSDRISGSTSGRSSCRVSFLVVSTLGIS